MIRHFACSAARPATLIATFAVVSASALQAQAAPDTTKAAAAPAAPRVTLQGFADAYYAWDTGRPPLRDRVITTQAVRHSEFNINLAHVALKLESERVRGRVALQAGTSVQSNYAGEPTVGANSGPSVSRFVEEATAGVRLAANVWVDAGIYYSPIGNESWTSTDNPTYTRSLTAEYTPYYLSGARLSWQVTPRFAIQTHLVNGWQKISDDDEGKAAVVRADYTVGSTTLSFSGFAGAERAATAPGTDSPQARAFAQLLLKSSLGTTTTLWLTGDLGRQSRAALDAATWGSVTGIVQQALSPTAALSIRAERYIDRQGAVLAVDGAGAAVTGLSANVDVRLPAGAVWRAETRWQRADRAIFPDRTGTRRTDVLLVTSLAVTFDQLLRGPSTE